MEFDKRNRKQTHKLFLCPRIENDNFCIIFVPTQQLKVVQIYVVPHSTIFIDYITLRKTVTSSALQAPNLHHVKLTFYDYNEVKM